MTREADLTIETGVENLLRLLEGETNHGTVLLLDVREQDEWEAGHLPGSEHHPLGQLEASDIPRGRPVLTICRSGRRSAKAADRLAATHTVCNLDGGLAEWTRAGAPLVDAHGETGRLG